MPRSDLNSSTSATRWCVVFALRSTVGALAWGRLRPHPRWSNSTYPIRGGVEEPALSRRESRARSSVEDHRGLAARTPADLPVQKMAVADVENPGVVGLDRWIQFDPSGR